MLFILEQMGGENKKRTRKKLPLIMNKYGMFLWKGFQFESKYLCEKVLKRNQIETGMKEERSQMKLNMIWNEGAQR